MKATQNATDQIHMNARKMIELLNSEREEAVLSAFSYLDPLLLAQIYVELDEYKDDAIGTEYREGLREVHTLILRAGLSNCGASEFIGHYLPKAHKIKRFLESQDLSKL